MGSQLLGAVETNLQVPTTTSTVISAGTNGTKVEEIDVEATTTSLTPTTVAGLVYVFLHDGSTYHLYDTIAVTAVSGTATVAPFRASKTYSNLWIKSGWSVRCSQSETSNASILKVSVFAADL